MQGEEQKEIQNILLFYSSFSHLFTHTMSYVFVHLLSLLYDNPERSDT